MQVRRWKEARIAPWDPYSTFPSPVLSNRFAMKCGLFFSPCVQQTPRRHSCKGCVIWTSKRRKTDTRAVVRRHGREVAGKLSDKCFKNCLKAASRNFANISSGWSSFSASPLSSLLININRQTQRRAEFIGRFRNRCVGVELKISRINFIRA